ncbi:ADCL4 protein, partial [Lophotis ruficrista]|nr:ADCL4 protein [Lophotis ruficrista]
MAVVYTLLVLFLAVFVAGFILLVMGAMNFDFSNSEIPPGVNQPVKLRIIHVILICRAVVGKILENTGICSQVSFVRYVQGRKTLGADPKLFIKDRWFEKVPVRIYQPKVPPASQRRGVMFFHGGGWVSGSLVFSSCNSLTYATDNISIPEKKTQNKPNPNPTKHFFQRPTTSYAALLPQTVTQWLYLLGESFLMLFFRLFPIYLNGDASNLEEVLEGSHIPIDIKLNYSKWVSPDNIPEKFKVRGYKPHVLLDCTTEVYETVKRFCEPNLCPLLAEDAIVHQLPESFILTCEYDVLRDDGLLYKKRLEDNGVRVTWYHLEDGFHGIINSFNSDWLSFSSGKRGLDNIV